MRWTGAGDLGCVRWSGAGDLGCVRWSGAGDLGCVRWTGAGPGVTDRGLIGADGVLGTGAPLCGARLEAFDGEASGLLGGLFSDGVGLLCAPPGVLGLRPAVGDTLLSVCCVQAANWIKETIKINEIIILLEIILISSSLLSSSNR